MKDENFSLTDFEEKSEIINFQKTLNLGFF